MWVISADIDRSDTAVVYVIFAGSGVFHTRVLWREIYCYNICIVHASIHRAHNIKTILFLLLFFKNKLNLFYLKCPPLCTQYP